MFEPPRLLFKCAICERDIVDYPQRNGRDRQLAPICRACEGYWGHRSPHAGAFMDRRVIAQLSALTNCLSSTAHVRQFEGRYVRS